MLNLYPNLLYIVLHPHCEFRNSKVQPSEGLKQSNGARLCTSRVRSAVTNAVCAGAGSMADYSKSLSQTACEQRRAWCGTKSFRGTCSKVVSKFVIDEGNSLFASSRAIAHFLTRKFIPPHYHVVLAKLSIGSLCCSAQVLRIYTHFARVSCDVALGSVQARTAGWQAACCCPEYRTATYRGNRGVSWRHHYSNISKAT